MYTIGFWLCLLIGAANFISPILMKTEKTRAGAWQTLFGLAFLLVAAILKVIQIRYD